MEDSTVRKVLSWIIKLATIWLTVPATVVLARSIGAPVVPAVALVEGAFLAFWLLMESGQRQGAVVAYYALGTIAMYAMILRIGGVAGLPLRIAAGLAISEAIAPQFLEWAQGRLHAWRSGDSARLVELWHAGQQRRKSIKYAYKETLEQAKAIEAERVQLELAARRVALPAKPVASNGQGKSHVVLTALPGGTHSAECPHCDFYEEYDSAKAAAGGGNAHWRSHLAAASSNGHKVMLNEG